MTTLILDGLSVTAELVHDIISDASYSVRILSLRGVKNLNEPKLRAVLQMAVRPSRPEGTPKLRGLYIFGAKDPPPLPAAPAPALDESILTGWNQRSHKTLAAVLHDDAEESQWYDKKGSMISRQVPTEWASTVLACAGVISFDAVLCRGPRHLNSPAYGTINIAANSPPAPYVSSNWAVATLSVGGCAGCSSAPEGWTVWGESDNIDAEGDTGRFPLLAPPPLHSSNAKLACCPSGATVSPKAIQTSSKNQRRFVARCLECLHGRYCWSCSKWWCEKCFTLGQLDSHDGLYYKVRDGHCTQCEEADPDRSGGHTSNPPAVESTEATTG